MLPTSRLLIAATLVLGATSIAAAQSDADSAENYGPVPGATRPVIALAPAYRSPYAFDEDQMLFHAPVGRAALARADVVPAPRSPYAFDEDQMLFHGPAAPGTRARR